MLYPFGATRTLRAFFRSSLLSRVRRPSRIFSNRANSDCWNSATRNRPESSTLFIHHLANCRSRGLFEIFECAEIGTYSLRLLRSMSYVVFVLSPTSLLAWLPPGPAQLPVRRSPGGRGTTVFEGFTGIRRYAVINHELQQITLPRSASALAARADELLRAYP